MHKFIFYLKDNKNVVMTTKTNLKTPKEYVEQISDVMSSNEISKFETETDILIVKPIDIIGVHVVLNANNDNNIEIEPSNKILIEPHLQAIVPDIDLGDIGEDENSDEELDDFSEDVDLVIKDIEPKENVENEEDPEEEEDDIDSN